MVWKPYFMVHWIFLIYTGRCLAYLAPIRMGDSANAFGLHLTDLHLTFTERYVVLLVKQADNSPPHNVWMHSCLHFVVWFLTMVLNS